MNFDDFKSLKPHEKIRHLKTIHNKNESKALSSNFDEKKDYYKLSYIKISETNNYIFYLIDDINDFWLPDNFKIVLNIECTSNSEATLAFNNLIQEYFPNIKEHLINCIKYNYNKFHCFIEINLCEIFPVELTVENIGNIETKPTQWGTPYQLKEKFSISSLLGIYEFFKKLELGTLLNIKNFDKVLIFEISCSTSKFLDGEYCLIRKSILENLTIWGYLENIHICYCDNCRLRLYFGTSRYQSYHNYDICPECNSSSLYHIQKQKIKR